MIGVRTTKSSAAAPQRGFTILEVIIAVGILLASLTAIFQLLSLGTRAATQGDFRSQAVVLADAKMNEAIAGVNSLESSSETTIEEAPDWTWSMTVEDASLQDLLSVTVTVTREGSNPGASHSYSLNRYVRDPQLFIDAALGATE